MINQVYQLVAPRQFEISYKSRAIHGEHVIVRPQYLSICAADQRYYTGSRSKEVLSDKLPMSLIHEAVGEVVYDSKGKFSKGTKVLLVPNTPVEENDVIGENYLRSSKFRSSGFDGFMQDYVFMKHDRVVPLPDDIDMSIVSFTELVSVSWHALQRFDRKSIRNRNCFGVWGDGNLGYITALLLRTLYPKATIYVFGKTDYKLQHFSFVDETFHINHIPKSLTFDHAFECVGGKGSQAAINQIIDYIAPEGSIGLLGVSEYDVEINTRMVLEKGLTLIGSSRSSAQDFQQIAKLYHDKPEIVQSLSLLKGNEYEVKNINQIIQAFEEDLSSSWGKTVLKWTI